jgi:hypothetical protein
MKPRAESVWLWNARSDLGVFAGAAVFSVLVVVAGRWAGVEGETPLWVYVALVMGIDVAHVWSTLYRVYFDRAELARRPVLYVSAPLLALGLGVSAYAVSEGFFWRVMAYVAVWHFIRQQVGWMALYGRRARDEASMRRFDALVMWSTTLGPVLWWHGHLPRPFWWFKEGDFLAGLSSSLGTAALWVNAGLLGVWCLRAMRQARVPWGKGQLLASTWVCWFGGIVIAEDDFAFTVMNVTLHGVPYVALLWRYTRARTQEGSYGPVGRLITRFGIVGFLGVVLALAFQEELLWDRLVWHERPQLFGAFEVGVPLSWLALVVPLLALPQVTHYVLDGFIWRVRDDASLLKRLGWNEAPSNDVA